MPYFGYARQDSRAAGRTPISAKLVANLITRAGAERVLTVDLHAGQLLLEVGEVFRSPDAHRRLTDVDAESVL